MIHGVGRINRYAPDGSLREVRTVPSRQCTCCSVGGPGPNRLYVTTATENWSDEQRRADPAAGLVYRLDTDATRRPQPRPRAERTARRSRGALASASRALRVPGSRAGQGERGRRGGGRSGSSSVLGPGQGCSSVLRMCRLTRHLSRSWRKPAGTRSSVSSQCRRESAAPPALGPQPPIDLPGSSHLRLVQLTRVVRRAGSGSSATDVHPQWGTTLSRSGRTMQVAPAPACLLEGLVRRGCVCVFYTPGCSPGFRCGALPLGERPATRPAPGVVRQRRLKRPAALSGRA